LALRAVGMNNPAWALAPASMFAQARPTATRIVSFPRGRGAEAQSCVYRVAYLGTVDAYRGGLMQDPGPCQIPYCRTCTVTVNLPLVYEWILPGSFFDLLLSSAVRSASM
jgi:hypothetical protein